MQSKTEQTLKKRNATLKKELAAKNRELEIEAALERVRTVAIGINKPGDLPGICEVLYTELQRLGFNDLRNAMINIHGDEKSSFINYDYSDEIGKSINHLSYDIHPLIEKQVRQVRSAHGFSHTKFAGKDLDEWKAFRKKIGEKDDPRIENAKALHYYFYSVGTGSIGISTFSAITKEILAVLKRFRNVFDFAYRRYLDVAKAEAQAREAKIELALERVRARTMAMQKSDELPETASVLFQQFKELGQDPIQITIGIINEEAGVVEFSVTDWSGGGLQVNRSFNGSIEEPTLLNKEYKAWKEQKKSLVVDLSGEELNGWVEYRNTLSGVTIHSADTLGRRVVSFAFFSKGHISISTPEPCPPETIRLLERFAAVFEQTYTRFLDLQKAEAQAREAQIELGLERVRASAMAMHNTDGLYDTAEILYKELFKLGIESSSSGFGLVDEEAKRVSFYGINPVDDKILRYANHVPIMETKVTQSFLSNWKTQVAYHVIELDKKETIEHETFMAKCAHASLKEYGIAAPFTVEEWLANSPKEVKLHFFNFQQGCLFIVRDNRLTDVQEEMVVRFTKVFQLTYTRFLDLQKAEAQAREAQIQLALERVRARTMAMQRSDDLQDAASLLFQQVKALGTSSWTCGFQIWDEDKMSLTAWMGTEVELAKFIYPGREDATLRFYEALQRGETLYVEEIGGEAIKAHYNYMKTIPGPREALQHVTDAGFPLPTFQIFHVAYFTQGFLLFITYERVTEMHDVFKRFAKVFEQTYTRFLDLQKAEAQAREAKIEAALEKVRSRTMAMQKADELREAGALLYNEISKLGIPSMTSGYALMDEDGKIDWQYMVSPEDGSIFPEPLGVPRDGNWVLSSMTNSWKKQEPFQVVELNPHETIVHQTHVAETTINFHLTAAELISFSPERLVIQTFNFKHGYILMVGGVRPTEDQIEIMVRFTKVFEQTYTRFLDLQKAEAQARESQIQLAMERVRARTMAMQTSEELREAASLLFKQVADLGTKQWSSGFDIWNANDASAVAWMSNPDGSMGVPFSVPYTEDPFFKQIYEAKQSGEDFFVMESSGKELEETYQYLFNLPEAKKHFDGVESLGFQMPKFQITHCAFFSQGYLMFITFEPAPEMWDIFKRFAKVFEQTYTRFLDLQKAEAQARESQIEAALERVRSRSMAMQKSEELAEVATILFQQVKALGVPQWTCGFSIWEIGDKAFTFYPGSPEGEILPSCNVPLTEYSVFIQFDESRRSGDDLYVNERKGEELKAFYQYMHSLPGGLGDMLQGILDAGLQFPTFQIDHIANFSHGNLLFVTYEPVPEMWDIFKRFAKVFEQTYTRFLDLQKAEAQARESQIEAALERVRSRSMGMQKSEELKDVIKVIFEQCIHLNIKIITAGFIVDYMESDDWNIWIANNIGSPSKAKIPYFDSPIWNLFIEAKQQGLEFFARTLTVEEKNSYFKQILTFFPKSPEEANDFIYSATGYATSFVFLKNVCLFIDNFDGIPFSDAENSILKRFGKVFDQTYTRFLDLQKAEAQARESQIEAALERVRSRTMGMQRNEELAAVASLLFQQVNELGLYVYGCGFNIWQDDDISAVAWMAQADGRLQEPFTVNYTGDPFFQQIYDARKGGKDFLVMESGGEELAQTYRYMFGDPRIKKLFDVSVDKGFSIPTYQITHCVFFAQGYLMFISYEPCPDMWDVFKRFGKVFQQTYTRFLDLQKAEAQAREAQIESALEKVRSRSLGMHKSDELWEVIAVVFEKFQELKFSIDGAAFITTFIEGTRDQNAWVAGNDSQPYPTNLRLPYLDSPAINDIWQAKESGLDFFSKTYSFEEKNHWLKYAFENTGLKSMTDEFKNWILEQPYLTQTLAFGKNSLIGIHFHHQRTLLENEVDILKRFSKVFDQAYIRFLDLQKAEDQAREAQIEAALERVRSRSMGMQHSEELRDVIQVIYEQIVHLGIDAFGASFILDYKESEDWFQWAADVTNSFPTLLHIPYFDHPYWNKWNDAKREGVEAFAYTMALEEKNSFITGMVKYMPNVSSETTELVLGTPGYTVSNVLLKNIALFIDKFSTEPYSDQDNAILMRFGKVFEQTYTRFKDLEKAEAQAREAQIEAALERVRSRTMAMQRSEELAEVATVLFQQVKALGVPQWTCGFSIFEIDDKEFTWYPGSADGDILPPFKIPLREHPVFISFNESRKRGDELFVYEKGGEYQADHYGYMRSLPGGEEMYQNTLKAGLTFPAFQIDHIANFSHGNLVFITYEHFPEMHDVFKRFAKVFEQTYTRFLDLQKAEAQAREAKIEAALERVRSRTMGMQHSNELQETALLLLQQVLTLGVPQLGCGFNIWDDDRKAFTSWMGGGLGENTVVPTFKVPTSEDIFLHIREAAERGESLFVREQSGEELEKHYRYMFSLPLWKDFMKGWTPPTYQVIHCAFFAQGFLMFVSTEPVPQAHDIFQRFAKVFEQTYTRFLDLQKSEAQAREAQIEASLERVRSKTMAMHNSEDVGDTVATMFDEFVKLGIQTNRCGILILSDEPVAEVWTAKSNPGGKANLIIGKLDMTVHELLNGIYKAWKNKEAFYNYTMEGNDLRNYYEALNDLEYYPTKFDMETLPSKEFHSDFYFPEGSVFAFTAAPIAEEISRVIKRFAGVFGQTYRRYLDLQKAEAQAREAQIEAALERVRSRSMGMQKSEELREIIQVIYEQFIHLGFKIDSAGFATDYLDNDDFNFWFADAYSTYPNKVHIPYFDHPQFNRFKEAKEKGRDFYASNLTFEEKNKFFEHVIKNSTSIPEEFKDVVFSAPGYMSSHVILKNIVLYILNYTDIPFSGEENAILMRFGKVFEQAYIRFNDLKNAEAQALEVIKRASVDRVRAEIASMRTTNDLERITPLIWNELTTLGVPFIRCGVFIMDEETQQVESFLSTPGGKAIAAFRQPYNAPAISAMVDSWHKKEIYRQHWNEAQFIEFTSNLVQQGAVTSGESYLTETHPTDLYLHFLPFLQGMLYAGNTAPLSEDQLQLVQNLADAFSTAYARYEDFNKLEAAKKQVDHTLNELQVTQKQLIQSEKMASLGELTAGIAHEIQNPLNFVNNFSEVSKELLDEMKTELDNGNTDDAKEIANDVIQNLEKINHHGKRADAIVKGMLQHSRSSTGVKEQTDINALADEYLRLAYHGLRAKDKGFNAEIKTDFDTTVGKINVIPQDIGRVILNLITNAFYAVNEQKSRNLNSYEPAVSVSTKKVGDNVEIKVNDNGNGIPQKIVDKIFQPFFTTKPTGEGTGLGLSLSYDIVKAHGGEIKVETKEGEGSEFIIQLPTT